MRLRDENWCWIVEYWLVSIKSCNIWNTLKYGLALIILRLTINFLWCIVDSYSGLYMQALIIERHSRYSKSNTQIWNVKEPSNLKSVAHSERNCIWNDCEPFNLIL